MALAHILHFVSDRTSAVLLFFIPLTVMINKQFSKKWRNDSFLYGVQTHREKINVKDVRSGK